MSRGQTPSQTIGPFFAYCLTPEPYGYPGLAGHVLAGPRAAGRRVRIEGRIYDGEGAPVTDALVEIWQANAAGRYRHPADDRAEVPLDPDFRGFGRAGTDAEGRYAFETVKPGRVPGRGNALQAPHIALTVFARGLFNHAFTRLYFGDETAANAEDPVLSALPEARRATLVAERAGAAGGGDVYRFDIRLQGAGETVFFDA